MFAARREKASRPLGGRKRSPLERRGKRTVKGTLLCKKEEASQCQPGVERVVLSRGLQAVEGGNRGLTSSPHPSLVWRTGTGHGAAAACIAAEMEKSEKRERII